MEGEEREVKRRREDEETAKVVADLEARLEASEERADEAEAKAEAMKTKARLHSNRLFKSFARAQKRIDEIETSKTSGASSSTITYSEEEVEEMEDVIGEITKELAELKAVHKHDEVEYERNRSAVVNFRLKYREGAPGFESSRLMINRRILKAPGMRGEPGPRSARSVSSWALTC